VSGGGLTSDHATKTIDADQAWNRSARSEQRSSAAAPGGAGNQQTQRLARGSAGSTRGGPRQQPADSPLVDWVRKAAGAFMAPRPSGVTAPGDRYGSLDDPNFNAQYIADDLNRAIDSSEHTLMLTSDGFWAMKEDVSRERRKVDAGTVISRLENRTPLQLNEIRARYAAFGHRPADALDTDLFRGGESGRQADLTDDQVKRIKVLLRGTVAETRGGWLEEDAERNRLEAVAIELHELFSDDLDDAKRERVMLLHRRPIADIDVIDSIYAKNYGYSALAYDIHRRLEGAQLFRLGLLRDGEIAKADAVAIEDKRRQIEELNKQDAEVESRSTAETGFRLLAGVSTLDALAAEKRRKQREELTGEIEAILEQNKQEALADQSNLGKQSGEVIAARLTTILNQGDAEGHTLRGLLTATLSPRSAEAIAAAVDPRNSGGDLLVETAAAQLREMVRNDKATGSAIESMLRSLRQSAVHDIRAKAHDPKVPLEEQQAITKDIPAAVEQLAQHYADGLVAAYDRMTGPFEPKFAQVVSGLKDADATHLEFARTHAGALAAGRDARLLDLADLQHAMDTKDVDGVKAVLRRQRNGNAVQKLVADYDNIGIGRNLTRELFGKFFDDTDVTPEAAAELENTRFTNGMVTGRDAAQIAELLARPVTGPSGDSAAAEVAWMASGASGEYDVTMEHRGVLRHVGEWNGDPETKQLMAATRDRVNELKTQWERTTDPQERQHLFSEIRKARAALTGDADAYEKETEQIVAEFRSAVSFAVSIALAVALPGVGAGLSFLEATALNIGANIAANIVIKGDTYSVSDLEGDLLGGLAGAAGGKLGELGGELLGKVAQKIAGPVARETGIVAEQVGIKTGLSAAAEALTSKGEQIVIDTAEVQAKLAGTAAKAADSTLVSVAKETGNILGGTAATKAVSGDASVSGADVVQTAAGIFGGKLAARRVAAKAARSMVRGGESAPASKGAEPHAQELAPPAAAPEVETSTAGPVEPPSVAEPQVTSPTLSGESGTTPAPTKDAAPPALSADRPPAAAAESPAPSDEAEPGITRTTDPNAAAASMTSAPELQPSRPAGPEPTPPARPVKAANDNIEVPGGTGKAANDNIEVPGGTGKAANDNLEIGPEPEVAAQQLPVSEVEEVPLKATGSDDAFGVPENAPVAMAREPSRGGKPPLKLVSRPESSTSTRGGAPKGSGPKARSTSTERGGQAAKATGREGKIAQSTRPSRAEAPVAYRELDELYERFPGLRRFDVKVLRRGAGRGMYAEGVLTGTPARGTSFEAVFEDKRIQLDDIDGSGVLVDPKAWERTPTEILQAKRQARRVGPEGEYTRSLDFDFDAAKAEARAQEAFHDMLEEKLDDAADQLTRQARFTEAAGLSGVEWRVVDRDWAALLRKAVQERLPDRLRNLITIEIVE
jgi:hypothetical protein